MIFSTLEHILTHISFSLVSIGITIFLITLAVDEIIGLYDSSEKGVIATFLCITGLLVTRWAYSGHFPLSNLYESLLFLSWSFSIIHMVPYFKKQKSYLRTITSSSTIFTQGLITSGLLSEIQQSEILVPALQPQWLMMHVSMMVLGYAALLCGSLLSVALLIITFRKALFACIVLFGLRTGTNNIRDYAGLYAKDPFLALSLALCLLSLGGLPPLAGFFGKLHLFWCGWQAGLYFLVSIGLFTSVVSIYYYLKIIKLLMTGRKQEITPHVRNYRRSPLRSNNSIELSMIVCVIASTIPGISMNPIIAIAQDTLF